MLADIYLSKNDQFQAKHTLKSLYENYNDDDDGTSEASKKLLIIENEENWNSKKPSTVRFKSKLKNNKT